MIEHLPLASSGVDFGAFQWTGDFTTIDLIAASTNSLNGALLARRPDHYKNWTVVGILLMALLMGLGGGITRDVLVGQVPGALTNPAYITLALAFGTAGYFMAYKGGQLFREGLFQFMTSFSLPWYAIAGAQKGVDVGPPGPGHPRPRGRRPDRRAVVRGRHQRRAAQAVRPGRVVRLHGGHDRPDLAGGLRARRLDRPVRRDRVRDRLHVPRAGALPGLGAAARQGADRRVQARRRASDARTKAQGQVRSASSTTSA